MGYPNDVQQAGNYPATGNANNYRFFPGVCVLPVAEDAPTDPTELAAWSPVVTLRLHAPFRTREFTQVATKQQNPAPVAAPGDTGLFVFVGGNVTVTTNLNTTGVNFDWTIAASYTYVEDCVSRNQDGLVLGSGPYKTVTDRLNATEYGFAQPAIGAVAAAGPAATTGYRMGATLVTGSSGVLKTTWGYNQPSFYPGELFYSDLANGGKPVSEGGVP